MKGERVDDGPGMELPRNRPACFVENQDTPPAGWTGLLRCRGKPHPPGGVPIDPGGMPAAIGDALDVKFALGLGGRIILGKAPEGEGEAPNYGTEFHSRLGGLNANSTQK